MRDLLSVTTELLAAFEEEGYCTDCWGHVPTDGHDEKCPERKVEEASE